MYQKRQYSGSHHPGVDVFTQMPCSRKFGCSHFDLQCDKLLGSDLYLDRVGPNLTDIQLRTIVVFARKQGCSRRDQAVFQIGSVGGCKGLGQCFFIRTQGPGCIGFPQGMDPLDVGRERRMAGLEIAGAWIHQHVHHQDTVVLGEVADLC